MSSEFELMTDSQNIGMNNLFSLVRQVTNVSCDVWQDVEMMSALGIQDEIEKDLLFQLPSVTSEVECSVSVVPVTVMFVDLRNFTAMVEEYPPNQVVRQLNEYFSRMTRIIVEHHGILDKYMGDEIMAYFEAGSPLEYASAARRAVSAGVRMIETLEKLNVEWAERGWPVLRSGIGINSGPVLKGNIGSMIKMDTTIIGDTVNVASRLQQLNKDYDARLLISGTTHKMIQGEFEVRSLGEQSIRGKRQPVGIFEICLTPSA